MSDDIEFIEKLLAKTKTEFSKSPIYKKQNDENKRWGFSICGTPIQKGKGILFGINWGGSGEYEEQNKMPEGNNIAGDDFIKRSKHFFDEYLSLKFDELNFNYTNLCFFRTPKIDDLSFQDYKLSYPLFEEYVKYIQPPWIFSLGITSYDILKKMGQLNADSEIKDSSQKHRGATGKFLGFNFYAVPHPNAHLKNNSRKEIWAQVGKQFRNDILNSNKVVF